ncbi:DUF1003 domain-containing protein [Pyxidicoccus caerfyrddinensis]|uniref:DUF1003 domain-containing protein n=1 Tax=Pyxidicoccus caerfyrddinensis TaxID=2709663 RepID=UPI0013DA3890|nr:DUF1003 domain-containing protein [Pyxidicoccus caerfyrddinensis]
MTTSTGGGHAGHHHHGPHHPPNFTCSVCHRERPSSERMRLDALRIELSRFIIQRNPDAAAPGALICRSCRDAERLALVTTRLEEERGQLTAVEADVARRAAIHSTVAEDLEREFTRNLTFGQRAADAVARVGGSWGFVIGGLSVILFWVLLNSGWEAARPFDPYPFILLNLVLSCVAALQAPIIMMSQNRQALRDRRQADQDYRVNLKAELEVATLHEKLDHLMHMQWERMLELQQLQVELLTERLAHDRPPEPRR